MVIALKRTGRPAAGPVDLSRFREFAEVARFFRIEAEGRLPGASRPNGTRLRPGRDRGPDLPRDPGRMRPAGIARRPRGGAPADVRLVFDPRLAERLAAWSMRRARARIRDEPGRASQFTAVRSHIERMAALEDGRALPAPSSERAARWRARRSRAAPRIRRRRAVLPPGSPVGGGADQVAMKAGGQGAHSLCRGRRRLCEKAGLPRIDERRMTIGLIHRSRMLLQHPEGA